MWENVELIRLAEINEPMAASWLHGY